MKPPHLAINDEVSKEAVSQLRIFSMQKFRPKGRGFTPSEIFCINCSISIEDISDIEIHGYLLDNKHK
ncbi:MAG TPA: hypothetical protein VJH68_01365 [Candidatus Nanoarchaeia archaeon]|nr:hypothetical protein [Candidatus Nanoarchaeia archaeon]